MERQDTNYFLNLKLPNPEHSFDPNSSSIITEPDDLEINTPDLEDLRGNILNTPPTSETRFLPRDIVSLNDEQLEDLKAESPGAYQDWLRNQMELDVENYNKQSEAQRLSEQSRGRLVSSFLSRKKFISDAEKGANKNSKGRAKVIKKRFQGAGKHLKDVISQRKVAAKKRIGPLYEEEDQGVKLWGKGKKLHVRVELCRAVKDKLPCAFYVLLVSLWDRLGGSKIEISKKHRITLPKRHAGRYFHNCLRFEEDLEIRVPAENQIKPSMALSFELFILKNRTLNYDKPVAYGYFPLINSDFELVEGRFKVPLLKGEIDRRVEKFADIESKYTENLDSWLCNLYFQTKVNEKPDQLSLKLPEEFEEFQYSVTSGDGNKARSEGSRRLRYLFSEVFQDLGFRSGILKNVQMWVTVLILLFTLWLNRFTHYFGEWIYLNMLDIEVTEYTVFWMTFLLDYASDLKFGTIVGLLIFGNLFTLFVFMVFTLLAFYFYYKFDNFPTYGFRIGVLYGFCMLLDPLITTVDSVILANVQDDWEQESFLLYHYFNDYENSNFYGPSVTVLLYLAIMVVNGLVLYLYLVYVHMNGRVLDTYRRLTSLEIEFFLPYDSEVSGKYLAWVIDKAHRYQTLEGDARKVAVAEYTERITEKVSTHVAIYNVGKTKGLYRHFMRLPTGAICELSTSTYSVSAVEEDS